MWTYTPGWLSATSAMTANFTAVRLMIGDTDTNRQQLADEEILYLLAAIPSPNYAAATAAEMLAAKYAFLVNTENSELRISAAARHKHYLDMAKRLREGGPALIPGADGAAALAGAYGGGTQVTDVVTLLDNDNNVLPQASTRQDDFSGTDTTIGPTEYFSDD